MPCLCNGCLCSQSGYDCEHWVWCCFGSCDLCCVRHSYCCACNTRHRGCGCTTDKDAGECCKCGCYCCDVGCVVPSKLYAVASQCLCCYDVVSLPCSQYYIPEPICAVCGWACCPHCGCCIESPECEALNSLKKGEIRTEAMQR